MMLREFLNKRIHLGDATHKILLAKYHNVWQARERVFYIHEEGSTRLSVALRAEHDGPGMVRRHLCISGWGDLHTESHVPLAQDTAKGPLSASWHMTFPLWTQ